MHTFFVLLSFFQSPIDPVRAQEQAVQIHRSQVPVTTEPSSTGLTPYLRKVQVSRFQEKFNKLVEAVEQFSISYNQSQGKSWPADKAEALRKAMLELQKTDPNFKPDLQR